MKRLALLAVMGCGLWAVGASAQAIVTDTITYTGGGAASGTMQIAGAAGSVTAPIYNGTFFVSLAVGTYTVNYSLANGSQWTESWNVYLSATPLNRTNVIVQSSSTPASSLTLGGDVTGPIGSNSLTAPEFARVLSVQVPAMDAVCALGGDSSISGLTCDNSGNATSATPFTTTAAIAAGWCAAGRTLRIVAQFAYWSSASPSAFDGIDLYAGSTPLNMWRAGAGPAASQSDIGFPVEWDFECASTTAAMVSTKVFGPGGVAAANYVNTVAQPVTVGTGQLTLEIEVFFSSATAGNAIRLMSLKVVEEGTV